MDSLRRTLPMPFFGVNWLSSTVNLCVFGLDLIGFSILEVDGGDCADDTVISATTESLSAANFLRAALKSSSVSPPLLRLLSWGALIVILLLLLVGVRLSSPGILLTDFLLSQLNRLLFLFGSGDAWTELRRGGSLLSAELGSSIVMFRGKCDKPLTALLCSKILEDSRPAMKK